MAYCPRCGVETEDRLAKCPLCDTPIPEEVRNLQIKERGYPTGIFDARKMGQTLSVKQKRALIFTLTLLAYLLPILLTALLDYVQNGNITWSYFVIISLMGASGIAFASLIFFRRPVVLINVAILIVFCWFMLLRKQFPWNFLSSKDFKVILTGSLSIDGALVLIRASKGKWFTRISFLLTVISFFLTALDYILSRKLSWSLVADSALLPAALFILLTGKIRHRGFNILGLFFMLVTLMLITLDGVTGFSGWSMVTSVILGIFSLVSFVVDSFLFKDTDWKKVFHI